MAPPLVIACRDKPGTKPYWAIYNHEDLNTIEASADISIDDIINRD